MITRGSTDYVVENVQMRQRNVTKAMAEDCLVVGPNSDAGMRYQNIGDYLVKTE